MTDAPSRRINVKFSVRHRPDCGWTDADAPQVSRTPASMRGYTVRVHQIDDVTAVVCDCGARGLYRDDKPILDPAEQARQAAEREALRLVIAGPNGGASLPQGDVHHGDLPDGDLPGRLSWPKIEAAYRMLARQTTSLRSRRRTPTEPSRPEVAKELSVSPATLKRACIGAGKGSTWPPTGL